MFSEDEQMMEMEVNAIQQENEFPEDNEEEESGIVQLRMPDGGSQRNNKVSTDVESEDGELKKDEEDEEFQREKDRFKGEFLDEAMNQFQDIFMSSEFMQTMVDMVKRNIAKETAGNQNHSRGQSGENHRVSKKTIDNRADRSKIHPSQGNNSMNVDLENILSKASVSELTIYKNAVEDHINKRDSSSSDKVINTSDEIEIEGQNFMDGSNLFKEREKVSQVTDNHNMINDFIAEVRERQRTGTYANDGGMPGTSGGHGHNHTQAAQHRINPEDRAKNLIRNAEMGKARIHETPGRFLNHSGNLNKVGEWT